MKSHRLQGYGSAAHRPCGVSGAPSGPAVRPSAPCPCPSCSPGGHAAVRACESGLVCCSDSFPFPTVTSKSTRSKRTHTSRQHAGGAGPPRLWVEPMSLWATRVTLWGTSDVIKSQSLSLPSHMTQLCSLSSVPSARTGQKPSAHATDTSGMTNQLRLNAPLGLLAGM